MTGLKDEIAQQKEFSSAEEEALLNLLRTADCIERAFHLKTREWGVTSTQYNVLRILRGAHPQGLTCTAIGSRMITAEPDITRLLGRLKKLKLIRQRRDLHDRRVVITHISDAGLELLGNMDPVIRQAPKDLIGHLAPEDVGSLIRLLEAARGGCAGGEAKVTCEGECATASAASDRSFPLPYRPE